ncbi:STM3941 family protein [Filibacter tadaridae]|uniref:Uncharacterized protein n=1 Tax=Filibacter tadaridae TaxID=2483811 RepID=A0A3P5XKJ7_9BACL|nr:STM3941 family protein [Filibacter tadaridae]VDC28201.1 hypothetical protein FILTAD_01817 [Filibacter tadaridae]
MNDFSFEWPRKKLILLASLSLLFIAVGLILLVIPSDKGILIIILGRITGIIAILFGGWPLLFVLNVALTKKPAFSITKDGIIDHSTVIDVGLIRWEDIEDIIFSSGSIKIFTYDPALIIHRTRGIKRWLHTANQNLKSAQVNVIFDTLPCSLDELKHEVSIHWNKKSEDLI